MRRGKSNKKHHRRGKIQCSTAIMKILSEGLFHYDFNVRGFCFCWVCVLGSWKKYHFQLLWLGFYQFLPFSRYFSYHEIFFNFQSQIPSNLKIIEIYRNPSLKTFRKSGSTRSDFFCFCPRYNTLYYFMFFSLACKVCRIKCWAEFFVYASISLAKIIFYEKDCVFSSWKNIPALYFIRDVRGERKAFHSIAGAVYKKVECHQIKNGRSNSSSTIFRPTIKKIEAYEKLRHFFYSF